ncbi:MAG: Peptidyl-prolyl cis-trans isomerase SurA [Bacteroidota bacterium]|jgi:peptidyl-prolyl cis-trans isomerase SurA
MFSISEAMAQEQEGKGVLIDEVVGVVGKHTVLLSDIENELERLAGQGMVANDESRCIVLEELLFQRLLVNQADLDSMQVSDAQVNGELENRMRYYIQQAGSEQKLEAFMGKSIAELKEDYRDDLKRVLLARNMQSKITGELKVTPSEVRQFFNAFPQDSLPFIDSEIELAQIVKKAPVNPEERRMVIEKMEKLRERINNGEDFAALAVLYSEDGSAPMGGELGFKYRSELVPEFAAAAFSLKGKEVSQVIESQYGFHIVQLIIRKGEQANVRHILMSPKIRPSDFQLASSFLDSIKSEIASGKIDFAAAAQKYSDDEESKNNNGNVVNMASGTTRFTNDELDPGLFFVLDKMKTGEISVPVKYQTNDGKQAYRILLLKTRTNPHRANLKEDYQRIQSVALQNKQNKVLSDWVRKKQAVTYVRVDDKYRSCKFRYNWFPVKQGKKQ